MASRRKEKSTSGGYRSLVFPFRAVPHITKNGRKAYRFFFLVALYHHFYDIFHYLVFHEKVIKLKFILITIFLI